MMQDQTLRIRVLFFAIAGELAGESSIELELDSPATASDAEAKLKERYDWLGKRLSSYRIAVDEEFARSDTPVRDGSELAIIPPVSGG
ncbi:MAG: MoaD/ThiS family protein [Planctomycetota bacterium]|tara:strand:- start:248 stop:511 length:264 start_codon:yes stop_codon:yes gene_type:complete